ncbi:Ff.00g085330.m01.CDS01 [Fusarium sp. VM40]|nr:Ff.00g085330.m01.CDS01 [Fusarium sp. VM40]
MPSSIITSLLCPADKGVTIQGEVFEAEATGTRYMLRGCKSGPDGCDHHTAFLNIGPWASKTLPNGAAETGVYDVHGTIDGTVYSSVCEMSRSVIESCVVSKQSGFDDSTEYTMSRTKGEMGADFTLLYQAVTLTGGLSKLATSAETTAPTKTSSSFDAPSTTETSPVTDASPVSATDEPKPPTDSDMMSSKFTATETTNSTTPAAITSAGSLPLVRAFAALIMARIATALVY